MDGIRAGGTALAATLAALMVSTPAWAVEPTLLSVSHENRHAVATYSMTGADDAFIHFASRPDRATDGSFFEEAIEHSDDLTQDEIQSGRWLDSAQLDPGLYYVLLRAYDFGCPEDPSCTQGYSNMLTVSVPEPTTRYRGAVTAYRYLSSVALDFRASPLGRRVPYRVCWRLVGGRRKCARGVVDGYDWNRSATDELSVRKRGMPRIATFQWYVKGRKVASKRARIPRG